MTIVFCAAALIGFALYAAEAKSSDDESAGPRDRAEVRIRDPFILPVPEERRYYMYGTTESMQASRSFEVYFSSDLHQWFGPVTAFRAGPGFRAEKNFWAPEVHFYKGRYYLLGSLKAENARRGTQIFVADRPRGPFKPLTDCPVTPRDWECLDGTLFVDENGDPWMVFCHEWVQVHDGEMCAMRLSSDLKNAAGEPVLLFRASEAPWVVTFKEQNGFVTDGPFLYRASGGRLLMIWSSFGKDGYAVGVARSKSGRVTGPWTQDPEPLYSSDGGHAMLFTTFDGQLMMSLHQPNRFMKERPMFIPVRESAGRLVLDKN